jgi:hypothetical protein
MNSFQLEKILKGNCHTKKYFIGVYSSNNIPLPKKFPSCFIANTDKKGNIGEHWVSFFVKDKENIEYFDSLGEKPNADISEYLSNFPKVNLSYYKIQSPFSDSCGHYCVYFIVNKCLGIKFNTIIKTLLDTKRYADLLVKYFIQLLLKR